jgi:DNA/RNA-binding domain of Phe-tRNA-synthetase-like protein
MLVQIDPAVNLLVGPVVIGTALITGCTITKTDPDLQNDKKEIELSTQMKLGSDLDDNPFIHAWRCAYKKFGVDPSREEPSAEALIMRLLKGKGFPTINTAVDSYNLISTKHTIPMGAYDADKLEGDIQLRFSRAGERFIPLGESETALTQGIIVYADAKKILTRDFNNRDSDLTKITLTTKNILLTVDGIPPFTKEDVLQATKEAAELIARTCHGKIESLELFS